MAEGSTLPPRQPLVPLLADEQFTPMMREVVDRAFKRSGRIVNSARAFANAGDLGAVTRRFFEDSWAHGTLPAPLRLLIRYKVSTTNACVYCSTHQVQLLEKAGADRRKLDNIHASDTHPAFDARERAALAFAEAMTRDAANIPEDVERRFVTEFTAAERTEIAIVAATMGLLNKVNDALRVPLEGHESELAG